MSEEHCGAWVGIILLLGMAAVGGALAVALIRLVRG